MKFSIKASQPIITSSTPWEKFEGKIGGSEFIMERFPNMETDKYEWRGYMDNTHIIAGTKREALQAIQTAHLVICLEEKIESLEKQYEAPENFTNYTLRNHLNGKIGQLEDQLKSLKNPKPCQ